MIRTFALAASLLVAAATGAAAASLVPIDEAKPKLRAQAIVTGNLKHYPDDLAFEIQPPARLLALLG